MNFDYKFRLIIDIMKSTASIFLVPDASNGKRCNETYGWILHSVIELYLL
jgi:hypothetical protein